VHYISNYVFHIGKFDRNSRRGQRYLVELWNKNNTRAPANATVHLEFHSQSDADISSRTEIQRVLGKTDSHHIPAADSFLHIIQTQTFVNWGKGWDYLETHWSKQVNHHLPEVTHEDYQSSNDHDGAFDCCALSGKVLR
jgi:hypothetical protein